MVYSNVYEMNEIDLKRFAECLWKCPFDNELFDSYLSFWSHLCELHGSDICQRHPVKGELSLGDIERPRKLTFCGHCFDFVVPSAPDRYPASEIDRHIQEQHPNPVGPRELKISISTDPKLIDRFMEQETLRDIYVCNRCTESFSDEASVAEHWAKNHRERPSAEQVVETDPERLQDALKDSLNAASPDKSREQSAFQEREDGYVIHHSPDVPRIRSKPSEHIIYIEREPVRLLDDELQELLMSEGWDSDGEGTADEDFDGGKNQQVHIELRFCNILDGYIPLVKSVRSILPPLPEGDAIEVSWQEEPEAWFPCKVNKAKRAIYNLGGRLKGVFAKFDSGVRLYITRIGSRRYRIGVKRNPHTVRDCKIFRPDGSVEIQDVTVEWESDSQVFRHQLTFQQMEALRAEAIRTNLSVRDAVYQVMEQLQHLGGVHVRKDVYEAVFLRLRTCSLATVWAQFRPEHECYVRVSAGWYRFDASKLFPAVRYVTRQRGQEKTDPIAGTAARAARTKIRIRVKWSLLGKPLSDKVFDTNNSAQTMASFLGSLIREFGPAMLERLTRIAVSRGHPLSRIPDVEFHNPADGTVYCHKLVPETNLYLLTNSSTEEKHDDIRRLVAELGFHPESIEVSIVPNPTRNQFLATL
jgi:hypothetical protein